MSQRKAKIIRATERESIIVKYKNLDTWLIAIIGKYKEKIVSLWQIFYNIYNFNLF